MELAKLIVDNVTIVINAGIDGYEIIITNESNTPIAHVTRDGVRMDEVG